MTLVREILQDKGAHVRIVDQGATALEAAEKMHADHIGGVLVMDGEDIVGIFTERDLMNRVVAARLDPAQTPVREVMTQRVAVCTPDTTLVACRTTMTRQRLRHLPVIEDGKLVGIISSSDLLARELHDQEETIRYLHEYMHGATR